MRNKSIPRKQELVVTTHSDYQTSMLIQIYEGESKLTKNNTLLGYCILNEIFPDVAGKPKVEILFDVDANSFLTVTARDM